MSQQNLCFFSTRCRFSQNFLEELSRTPFSKEFRFICVDPRPDGTRPQLPAYLKAVPTLMIHGEKAPRTDNEVINWIAERRLRGGSGSGSGGGNGGSGGGGLGGGSLEGIGGFDGPVAFGGEMFSSGDEQFAYIGDDTSTSQSAMVRLAGNMASLDNIDAMVAPDARARGAGSSSSSGGSGGGKAQSAKGKALDDAFASYQAARDRDMPGGQRRI
jgi:hypothetical protein